ncbi:MAG TPA: signal peptidase I [Thermoanaerobaculia bacterium]|nr:signal peptidase I [Thermoanaerobaculia bacterium]
MKSRILAAIALCTIVSACTDGQRAVIRGQKSYRIDTASMEPTLMKGEHAFAQPYKEAAVPQRGDVIAFKYPVDPKIVFAKRVVGVPGDTIQLVRKRLYLNGQPLTEGYVVHKDAQVYDYIPGLPEPYKSRDRFGPVKVGPDEFFVLGDNRDQSSDSRYWGMVPRGNILGKIVSAGEPIGELRPVQ